MISSSFCLALRSASFASVRSCFRWSASFNLEPESDRWHWGDKYTTVNTSGHYKEKAVWHWSGWFQTSFRTAPRVWQPAVLPPSSFAPSAFSPPWSSRQWPLISASPAQLLQPCVPTAWPPLQQSGLSPPAGQLSPQIGAGDFNSWHKNLGLSMMT